MKRDRTAASDSGLTPFMKAVEFVTVSIPGMGVTNCVIVPAPTFPVVPERTAATGTETDV